MPQRNHKLTPAESACVAAAASIQRAQVRQRLRRSMVPDVPWRASIAAKPASERWVCYGLLVLTSPLWLAWWLLNLLGELCAFPLRLLGTRMMFDAISPPGERNIQGMHRSLSPHLDLEFHNYVALVEAWVQLLYGPEKAKVHNLNRYLDSELMERARVSGVPVSSLNSYVRNVLGSAREKLSRALGYY